MLIVTEATIVNRGVLETRSLPRKFLGRVLLVPRGARAGQWLRLLVEMQFLRFLSALVPFAVVPLLSRDLAAPVMQAPLVMVVVIALYELKFFRLSQQGRLRAVDEEEADRRLDTLAFRAKAYLRRVAARHDLAEGELRLVVEQSELARIAPLTLVSVQAETPKPRVVPLDPEDRARLETLFDDDLTERDLLAVNHREGIYIRDIAQEARAVSAHARLAAYLEKQEALA